MISIIKYQEASTRFSLPSWMNDGYFNTWLLHEGDAFLNNHLCLDWEKLTFNKWKQWNNLPPSSQDIELHGVIVTGNLAVNASILNTNGDGGPCLIVLGDCQAHNLVGGGSDIHIHGDTLIAGAVYGFYNHGVLNFQGKLHSTIFINDDHSISANIKKQKHNFTYSSRDKNRILDNDDSIPAKLKKIVSSRLLLWGDILPALCRGEDIVKKSGEKTPETIQDWVTLVWKNPMALKKVPKELRTEQFYLSLFSEEAPLDALTVIEIVGTISQNAATLEVLVSAMQLSPKSLVRAPVSFDLAELYEQCFLQLKNPQKVFYEIPEQFRSQAMFRHFDTFLADQTN